MTCPGCMADGPEAPHNDDCPTLPLPYEETT